MILSDLIDDATKAGDIAGAFQILLATRTVDSEELEPGRVELSDIGLLQIDASAQEVDILPTSFLKSSDRCLTVADVRAKLVETPEIADFTLAGVVGFKVLSDGGNAQKTNPIIGSYVPAEQGEIWLLLYPQSQWPSAWFTELGA